MAISRRKEGSETLLNTKGFLTILKQCHLSGIVEECELKINKGKGKIEAIDISNQIMVVTEQKVISDHNFKNVIGLSNLELLLKFVQSLDSEGEEVAIEFDRKHMVLRAQKKRKSLDYILTNPDLIMTKPEYDEGESPHNKIFSLMKYNAPLSSSIIKDFLSYISLLKTKDTAIILDKKKISFICGGHLEHQITLELKNRANKKAKSSFQTKVNGDHLAKVLQTIDYDSDEPPEIHLAQGKPVMITCSKTSWALMPLSGEEEEEEEDEDD